MDFFYGKSNKEHERLSREMEIQTELTSEMLDKNDATIDRLLAMNKQLFEEAARLRSENDQLNGQKIFSVKDIVGMKVEIRYEVLWESNEKSFISAEVANNDVHETLRRFMQKFQTSVERQFNNDMKNLTAQSFLKKYGNKNLGLTAK